ncbi:solute carrier family 52, riboflavin transporter, member 3-A [Folsomia candida]|nr:solute carrier family 52, riboflavin transporter, member 3-A [Folsomia candida]
MTGLWVELPHLTQKLPESWALGSYLTVMIQLANVGPLIYWYARVNKLCSEVVAIHVQMLIGTIACIALIGWWDVTLVIAGKERSIVLYLASYGLSIVDCTSSVVFLPYMARFKGHHMTPYLIGEGLSGFLPSLVALAQGITDESEANCPNEELNITSDDEEFLLNDKIISTSEQKHPRFSANVFFIFLLVILLVSWIAFTLMDQLSLCRSERIDLETDIELESAAENFIPDKKIPPEEEVTCSEKNPGSFKFTREFIWLLGLMAWGCFTTFGAMPSLQSYSCLPHSADVFFYAVTLAGLAYPGACTVGFFLEIRTPRVLNSLTLIGSGIGVYILVCAVESPYPPFLGTSYGSVIMVASWVSYVALISYMKTMVSLELNDKGGNQAMFWCGFAQQFGAASGGAIIFCVINYTNIFKEGDKCG